MAGGKDKQVGSVKLRADGGARRQLSQEADPACQAEMVGAAFERCPPAASPNEAKFEISSLLHTLPNRIDEHIGGLVKVVQRANADEPK